jgi:hypothetical protein
MHISVWDQWLQKNRPLLILGVTNLTFQLRTTVVLLSLLFFTPSFATDIEGSCMVSFNVKDKSFNDGFSTMSCRILEARRLQLFNRVNALPSSGNLDVAATTKQLVDLESQLKSLEDSTDWGGWATSITGNALATISLSACAETAGTGCAIAIISKVLSVVGIIKSGVTDANKSQDVRKARDAITAIRSKLAGTMTPASIVRDRMVVEANQICSDVKANCLSN